MSNSFLIGLLIALIALPIMLYVKQKQNLTYYKLNGRDRMEIECWLKTRKWYHAFITNIKNEIIESHRDDNGEVLLNKEVMQEIDDKVDLVTHGHLDKTTISEAFCWMNSLEGSAYWGEREYEFLRWYFGQYVDFHLFK